MLAWNHDYLKGYPLVPCGEYRMDLAINIAQKQHSTNLTFVPVLVPLGEVPYAAK